MKANFAAFLVFRILIKNSMIRLFTDYLLKLFGSDDDGMTITIPKITNLNRDDNVIYRWSRLVYLAK